MTIRVGQGIDVHAFDTSRRLVVGGVEIDDAPGLVGHSDADVLCHAVADALLGAARLGDLGTRFPPTDRWRDASSIDILRATGRLVSEAGWRCINVDSTVVTEHPRLSPHVSAMSSNIADALSLDEEAVSVKATTTDGLGLTGRGEGMAAFAVVLVQR